MSEISDSRARRQQVLKDLIGRLHDGAAIDDVRADFEQAFGSVSAAEIAEAEEALIQDGMPASEVQRLCDVHASLVPGHPVHTLRWENHALEHLVEHHLRPHLEDYATTDSQSALTALREDVAKLARIDLHYLKKENLCFPFLEQYGITAPPKVMWGADDEIRDAISEVRTSLDSLDDRRPIFRKKMDAVLTKVAEMASKEENILFPMLLETLKPRDWKIVADGSRGIGFFLIDGVPDWSPFPEALQMPETQAEPQVLAGAGAESLLSLPSGQLRLEEIVRMLDALPLDITFVDKDDTVRYFSQGTDRIFARTQTIIGRKVTNCHPPASVHIVEKILDDFKAGTKDHEDFWIRMGQRYVYIRYFAVRAEGGGYLGTLEVTQDIAPVQAIQGEKRLVSDLE